MQINPNIFRGYDLRGVAGKDLNPENVEHLGKGYGSFLARRGIKKAVVGHDCRATSVEYKEAIIKGIIATGVDVIDIGLTLSGTFYWAQYYLDSGGGVMVTASHNPADYNGFKFATGLSETMVSHEIQELRQIVDNEEYSISDVPGSITIQDIKPAYLEDLERRFEIKQKFKVVVDPSNSTPGFIVPDILRAIGIEVIEKNCQLDPTFPLGTPDPTEKEVAERLAAEVLAENADMGFSYDADGDRMGVVDGSGKILWNDILVALFAADVIRQNPEAIIVYNTLCSKVVEETIKQKGGQPMMWRTGHSFIKAKAQKEKAKFAGELSGHFFFLDKFYGHDDGCYATLRLLDYLDNTQQSLIQAVSSLPNYISSPEIKIGCADELKVALTEKVSQKLKIDFPDAEVINDERAGDGVRLNMPDAMFVFRYSQNGPYLTIKFEAHEQEKYDYLKNYISQLLHTYPEIDWNFGVNVDSLR